MAMNASRILIATPVDGNPESATVSLGYSTGRAALERCNASVLPYSLAFTDDLARARSRAASIALTRSDWDWLLWWDDDVVVQDVSIVQRMIDAANRHGLEMIGAPYPRKRIQAKFPYKPLRSQLEAGKIEWSDEVQLVDCLGFGFMLTSRKCLQQMTHRYRHEWFTDVREGEPPRETVALFKQVHTGETIVTGPTGFPMRFRDLLSEDYSFCWRWRREMGDWIGMYVGPGSPLVHVGTHAYTGTVTNQEGTF